MAKNKSKKKSGLDLRSAIKSQQQREEEIRRGVGTYIKAREEEDLFLV